MSPLLLLAVAAVTLWAYRGSLGGPFIWDDVPNIPGNPRIRQLGWDALAGTSRPLTQLTFALNHALGGLDVRGYHAVNLVVHVLAALALYALARRTFASAALRPRFGSAAPWLAVVLAASWAVHPLQTEAVTYIVQRAESLAGLLYLLVLHALARGAESRRPLGWHVAAVGCCALGMAVKPVMATAPLMALLYDRAFLAGSFRAALARRRGLYVALAASVLVLPVVLAAGRHDWDVSTGFRMAGLTPGRYALTQLAVVAHYLRLAVWPSPLILDYAWPTARGLGDVMPGALLTIPLLALTAVGLARNRAPGFLGAWCFVILAPTSSFVPIADAAFEHRMYLPLAAPLALAAAGAWRIAAGRRGATIAAVLAALAVVGTLAEVTVRRNRDYASEVAIWSDNIAKHPRNPRPYVQLGTALAAAGRSDEAIRSFETALRLKPDYGAALGNLTHARDAQGRLTLEQAIRDYGEALRLDPALQWTRYDLGLALIRAGRPEEAAARFSEALARDPGFAAAHYGLGVALALQGRVDEGRRELERALELDPGNADALRALAGLDGARGAPGR